ncbi:MAG: bacillithiol system redox-active protein YtxJ [Candidatus Hydrogenedentota bacterium]
MKLCTSTKHLWILPLLVFTTVVYLSVSTAQADILSAARNFTVDNRNTPTENWEGPHVREIMNDKDWNTVLAESKKRPVFVFKHSTECPISAGAAFRTNAWLKKATKDTPKFYFVKVIERRPVSQKIAKNIDVKHESPQLLLLKDGKHVWNTSHEDITAKAIEGAIKKHAKTPNGSDSD